jgi:hypothetical protein
VTMKEIGDSGLFQADVLAPGTAEEPYKLKAEYPEGTIVIYDDPYRFLPHSANWTFI